MFSHIGSKLISVPLESDQFNLIFLNSEVLIKIGTQAPPIGAP
jgi:hypothetical protein